jgi:uncharacterized protein YbjT (DUF2867 family)
MHVVLGATGRVGSSVAVDLLDRGEDVVVVTRDPRRAEPFTRRGAVAAVTNIHDVDALHAVLQRGRSAFLLMPPADPSTDTVVEERRTIGSIARAVEGTHLHKVVVHSTYGAQPGEAIGDLGVLYEFEQAVTALGVRASVIRAAYYMSNWDSALQTARDEGVVRTFLPTEFALPMVAPADLGHVAARLLTDEVDHTGLRYVEGPMAYSPADVARAFAQALGRDVRTVETPRSEWVATFRTLGFSAAAADSYARMTALTVDGAARPEAPERGRTTLNEYVSGVVRRS